MKRVLLMAVVSAFALTACNTQTSQNATQEQKAAGTGIGIDTSWMDKSVVPGDDFFSAMVNLSTWSTIKTWEGALLPQSQGVHGINLPTSRHGIVALGIATFERSSALRGLNRLCRARTFAMEDCSDERRDALEQR